jgi:hypothetical protein
MSYSEITSNKSFREDYKIKNKEFIGIKII